MSFSNDHDHKKKKIYQTSLLLRLGSYQTTPASETRYLLLPSPLASLPSLTAECRSKLRTPYSVGWSLFPSLVCLSAAVGGQLHRIIIM